MSKSTCTMPECERAHLAKGMCKMHYYRVNRKPEPIRYIPRTCTDCGVDYQGSRGALTNTCPPCAKIVAIQKRSATMAKRRAEREAAKALVPKPTYEHTCIRCESSFEVGTKRQVNYCSDLCRREHAAHRSGSRDRNCRDCGVGLGWFNPASLCDQCRIANVRISGRAGNQQRRARMRGTLRENIKAREIYERDGWMCGICGDIVDQALTYPHKKSASLDHVMPIARGGTHTKGNVQCSHLSCNMRKGDKIPDALKGATGVGQKYLQPK